MKTKLKKIIGAIALVALFLQGGVGMIVWAQFEYVTTSEEACADLKPDYYNDEVINQILNEAEGLNYEVYQQIFKRAQVIYHGYVGCLFEYAESAVYKDDKFRQGGVVAANTQNTDVIDWMAPAQACLEQNEINQIIFDSAPEEMLGPVLQAHSDYSDYLRGLGESYSSLTFYAGDNFIRLPGTDDLYTRATIVEQINVERQMEIDSALVAIDLMFHYLKELRLAFVMHVHFQCTLKNLELYRKTVEELRKLIEPLPDQLRDASVTK